MKGTKAWLLAEDQDALVAERPMQGVRLLPNLDPLNAARDRELLVPEPELRKRIWRSLGGPGTVLAGGELRGLWRPAKKGRRLQVTVEALAPLPDDELAAEAERLAPFRAAGSSSVTFDAV